MPGLTNEILRLDYNQMQSTLFNVLGKTSTGSVSGYGQDLNSSQIPVTVPLSVITKEQWAALKQDIDTAFLHQTGIPSTLTNIVAGSNQISDELLLEYQTAVTTANQNKNLIAPTQKPSVPVVKETKEFSASWSESVTQEIVVVFDSADNARYFFNSAATIDLSSRLVEYAQSPALQLQQNESWANLLLGINKFSFNAEDFYSLNSSFQVYFEQSAIAPYSTNYYRVSAKANTNQNNPTVAGYTGATTVTFKIQWIDAANSNAQNDQILGKLISTVSETKPSGVIKIPSPLYSASAMVGAGTPTIITPIFELLADAEEVNEGATVKFTFRTRNAPANRRYSLILTGISSNDLNGSTIGTKTLTATGSFDLASFEYTVSLREDLTTEGLETLIGSITVPDDPLYGSSQTVTKQVKINDTSLTPTPRIQLTSTTATSVEQEGFGSSSTVTIKNIGTAALTVTNVQYENAAGVTGQQPNYGGLGGLGQTVIEPNAEATFTVAFSSNTAGPYTNIVKVTSNANLTSSATGPIVGSIKNVEVLFNVAAAAPNATLTALPSSTTLGTDGVTAGTVTQTIRINNTGNAKFTVNSVVISNESNLTYTIDSSPNGQIIPAAGQRSFTITWTGAVVGTISPRITVNTTGNDPFVDTIVNVIANLPSITTSVASISTTDNVNQTKTVKFFINNATGTANLIVSNIAVINKSNEFLDVTVTPTSFSLAPSPSLGREITVTLKSTRIATSTVDLSIVSNAPSNNPLTLPITFITTGNTAGVQYSAIMNSNSSNSFNVKAIGTSGSSANITVTGLAAGETFYAYIQFPNGKILNSTYLSAQSAFNAKVNPKTVNENGTAVIFDGTNATETASWASGTNKLWLALPFGKNLNGTVNYYNNGLFNTEIEIIPNPIIELVSSSEFVRTPQWPGGTYKLQLRLSNLRPTALFSFLVWRDDYNTNLSELGPDSPTQPIVGAEPSAAILRADANGNYFFEREFSDIQVGIFNIKVRQLVNNQNFDSNTVRVTIRSPELYKYSSKILYTDPSPAAEPPVNKVDLVWVTPEPFEVRQNQRMVIRRTFKTELTGEFILYAEADNIGNIEINGGTPNLWNTDGAGGNGGFNFGSGGKSYTIPSGKIVSGRNYITLDFTNTTGSNNFASNPGYIGFKLIHKASSTVVLTSTMIKNSNYY